MIIKRLKSNLLHLNHLRKAVGFEIFGAAINSELKLEILKNPPKAKVLVLAPHPDDDVFGCGGTLKLHSNQKDQIQVIYLSGKENREAEAKEAAKILGVNKTIFWRYANGTIPANKTTVELLKTKISEFKPNLIYAPTPLDSNPDHFLAAQILAKTLKKVDFNGQIFSYEVWTPIFANRLVNIDDSFQTKKQALCCHRSQLRDRNYLDAIEGLARYRASMFNVGEYAEAFFVSNKELYLKLFDLISFK